jgi:tetratricopeptide (TPR) repeat protein
MFSANLEKLALSDYLTLAYVSASILLSILVLPACSLLTHKLPPDKSNKIQMGKSAFHVEKDRVQEAYENFTLASLAISQGRHEKARKYLSIAIEKDPESIYLHRKMALLLKGLKKYESALAHAVKCVDIDPEDIKSYIILANLYTLMGNDDLALEQYDNAISLDPENQRVRLLITTILIRKGQFKKALDHLEKLTEQNPESVIAYYYRGRVNLEMEHYREAEESFLEALKLNKSQEPALFDLGTLYQMTDRNMDAVNIYEKLLEYYPDNMAARERLVNLYYKLGLKVKAEQQVQKIRKDSLPGEPGRQTLGLIYLSQGKLDESIEELNLIISAWPEDYKSRYYLATAYEEKGDIERALEHLSLINSESTYFINAQMHIAYLLDTQKKYDEARVILEKAIAINRERAELYLMLSSIYEAKEEYDNAIAVIKDGLKQYDNNIELIFRLGVLLDKSGDKTSCIDQMRRILEINPDHADSLNYIGYTYAEQGVKLGEAMGLIQKALKLRPDSGYIIDSLGWVYFQKGLYDEAIHHLEESAKLIPDDPTINEHLGDAYFKKKKYQEALKHYKKAVSLKHPSEENVRDKITEVERLIEQEK